MSLRPSQRLSRQRDFDRVFGRRCTAGDELLVVYVDSNGLGFNRLGLRTGRRLGKATVRSAVRRRMREAFRLIQHELPQGLDLICIAQAPRSPQASSEDFRRSLLNLVQRAERRLERKRATTPEAP